MHNTLKQQGSPKCICIDFQVNNTTCLFHPHITVKETLKTVKFRANTALNCCFSMEKDQTLKEFVLVLITGGLVINIAVKG